MDVVSSFAARYERPRGAELTVKDYLDTRKRDPMAYATAAGRMLTAIGEPQMADTRIFAKKVVKIYPASLFNSIYDERPLTDGYMPGFLQSHTNVGARPVRRATVSTPKSRNSR